MKTLIATAAIAALAGAALWLGPSTPAAAAPVPPPTRDVATQSATQTAVLAGGCFWGMEAVFEHLAGVRSVTSGFAGGTAATATYDQVSTERTGHAEAVKIVFDPRRISYGTLLRVYFSVAHDPTQVDGQFPDSGPSYRSAIFPQSREQAEVARAYIAQLTRARSFARPIATRLENGGFYPAEAYHQDFARRNPSHPYIVRWDAPRIATLRRAYPTLIRN